MCALESVVQQSVQTGIFINFNPRYLEHSFARLKETIDVAAKCHIPTDRCVFEVVESDEIDDYAKLNRIVAYCRQVGCRVALDDVGAGYNSLNLISEVQPDYIKIDRELISDVHRDVYRSRVAKKLVELAQELGIRTVVEGIEVQEEWEWAIESGADYGQGFFFARPAEQPPLLDNYNEWTTTKVVQEVK